MMRQLKALQKAYSLSANKYSNIRKTTMKSLDFLNEGIAEDAHEMHLDHEVQMARQELYHAAEDAIALHKLLRHVSEQQGLEGWVSSKITLAADYLKTIREHLEYQMMSGGPAENVVAVVGDSMPVAEGVAESQFDRGDYYNAHKGGEYGRNLIPGANSGGGESKGRDDKLKGQSKNLPPDPFSRTSGAVGKSGKGRVHTIALPDELDETSAGSVATVVNPTPKNKAKVGSLFGGTYKQSNKAK